MSNNKMFDKAFALHNAGKYVEAIKLYKAVLMKFPRHLDANYLLGTLLAATGKLVEAEKVLLKAEKIMPSSPFIKANLGTLYKELGQLELACSYFVHALKLEHAIPEAHNNLGSAYNEMGRFEDAEVCLRCAIDLNGDFAEAHSNLGNALTGLGRLEEAAACYQRALMINPEYAEVHNNLGNVLRELGRLEEAEVSCCRALEIDPNNAGAESNLGNIYLDLGRFEAAVERYRHALAYAPEYIVARSNMLATMNFGACHSISERLEEAREYGRIVTGMVKQRFTTWSCDQQPERLRVGFVSCDLYNHPVGYFMENMLKELTSSTIECIAYATGNKADDLTARIKPYFSGWKSLVGLDTEAAAKKIHEDAVHLLIDLSGHTSGNRLPLFAWKPAPVQASWLGYLATTGLSEIDYILGDQYVTPLSEAKHFTETLWQMPESYLCFTPPDPEPEVSPLPALVNGYITFGSFNNLTKLNDEVVAVWAKVLKAVPESRLYLDTRKLNDPTMSDVTLQRFAACGISSDRLILAYSFPRLKALEAYNRVDIALDPFPYPGCTTSVEGLWMGVPFITRRGDCFMSHMGESIAHYAGLPDWIAENNDDYVNKAVMHAGSVEHLAAMRATMRQSVSKTPYFDSARFAKHFEIALWGMWEQGSKRNKEL